VILPGAVDVEAGNCPIDLCGQHRNQAGGAVRDRPLRTGHRHGGTFTATGPLEAALEGAGQGVIGTGTDETDLLIIGGACTTPTPSLQSVVIGSTQATTTCGNATLTIIQSCTTSRVIPGRSARPSPPASRRPMERPRQCYRSAAEIEADAAMPASRGDGIALFGTGANSSSSPSRM